MKFRKALDRDVDAKDLQNPNFKYTLPNNLKEALEKAAKNNPSILVANHDKEVAKEALGYAKRNNYPTLDVELAATRYNNKNGADVDSRDEDYSAMLVMNYNLYNGGKDQAEKLKYKSLQKFEDAHKQRLEEELKESLDLAWNSYEMLNEQELEGVIAHELSHIKHYDILIGTIAAVFAGAIAMVANMMQFGAMFGGNNRQNSNPLLMILMAILLPIAASIIQMSVSRSREFIADEGAARMTGNPSGLQSALAKLENYSKNGYEINNATEQTAHMFIINPFSDFKSKFSNLFRTHPSTQDRIIRLEELKKEF